MRTARRFERPGRLGAVEGPAPGVDFATVAVSAVLGAAGGSLATVLVSKLLPDAAPGDGFTVRWLTNEGAEKRLDYGDDPKAALEKALELKPLYPDVQVIEVRQGRIVDIAKAGSAQPPLPPPAPGGAA